MVVQRALDRLAIPVRRMAAQVADLLFPPTCALCEFDLDVVRDGIRLCDVCRARLETPLGFRCPKCAAKVAETFQGGDCPWCRKDDLRFDRTFALGSYHDALREAVLVTKRFGFECMTAALFEQLWRLHGGSLAGERFDLVVPVPMHWLRRIWRGHNGPELLASLLAGRLRVRDVPRGLARRRRTAPQVGLSTPQRRENVHNAFVVRRARRFQGKRVLLVDDILTSGATCSEAARVLKRAGAATVVVAVLARAQGEA